MIELLSSIIVYYFLVIITVIEQAKFLTTELPILISKCGQLCVFWTIEEVFSFLQHYFSIGFILQLTIKQKSAKKNSYDTFNNTVEKSANSRCW